MKCIGAALSLIVLLSTRAVIATDDPLSPEEEQYFAEAQAIWGSLDRQQGEITLPGEVATLSVPESFYYLNPKDAETVLVEVWGNPSGAGQDLLGMLFPSRSTPFDEESWGVTIEYEEEGHVSDDDADDIDYDDLLSGMQEETREASKERVKQGYESIKLVGWASKPFYDKSSHKLHWAKELKFGDQTINTLNYNIRILGRRGVLVLNFIAGMNQQEMIESELDTVLALAEFDQGSKYEDFDPSIDELAAYGIGALVAGKVLAKTGLIALALVFLKKFGVFIVIAVGLLLRKLLKRRTA